MSTSYFEFKHGKLIPSIGTAGTFVYMHASDIRKLMLNNDTSELHNLLRNRLGIFTICSLEGEIELIAGYTLEQEPEFPQELRLLSA